MGGFLPRHKRCPPQNQPWTLHLPLNPEAPVFVFRARFNRQTEGPGVSNGVGSSMESRSRSEPLGRENDIFQAPVMDVFWGRYTACSQLLQTSTCLESVTSCSNVTCACDLDCVRSSFCIQHVARTNSWRTWALQPKRLFIAKRSTTLN